MKLYVGNLPYDISDASLRALFSRHGVVETTWIATTRAGRPHAYAFVHMPAREEAEAAISVLDGFLYQGTEITVHGARV